MPVNAIRDDYHGEFRDRQENFGGNQVVSFTWDQHMMIATPLCLPLEPGMKFGDVVQGILPGTFGHHPDFEKIDWDKAEWIMDGESFKPDFDKSIEENGIPHKGLVRFRTPELAGLNGTHN
ncbi:MAG: phenol hydroxylase [Salinisphaeraceae bacterium]|jgi:phenol hydroxylase P4 protein|nr:phenol hydroxylase [Salinisphaeraceae bacterium]